MMLDISSYQKRFDIPLTNLSPPHFCICPSQFLHKNNFRFVFTSSCLCEGSCLIYVICVYLHIVVSNTYCVVFLFCFLCLVYPMLPVSLDCPFLAHLAKGNMSFYHHLASVVCRLSSVNFSHFYLLL